MVFMIAGNPGTKDDRFELTKALALFQIRDRVEANARAIADETAPIKVSADDILDDPDVRAYLAGKKQERVLAADWM